MMAFRQKHVLLITNMHIVSYIYQHGHIVYRRVFQTDQDRHELFQYLSQIKSLTCSVLVDFIEEEFRHETVPNISFYERRFIIKRKLQRLFRDTAFKTGELQGKERNSRGDYHLMGSALISPEIFIFWLEQLSRFKIAVDGIYSIALLGQHLLGKLPNLPQNLLWINMLEFSGIRQSFLYNRNLKLSRLTLVRDWNNIDPGELLNREIDKTQRYLNRLRMFDESTPMHIWLTGTEQQIAAIRNDIIDQDQNNYYFYSLKDLYKKLGLQQTPTDKFAESLFVQYLCKRAPANQYAPATQRKYFFHRLATHAIKFGSLALLILGLYLGGVNVLDALKYQNKHRLVVKNIFTAENNNKMLQTSMPETDLSARQTKNVVEISQYLQARPHSPLPVFNRIADQLMDFPNLQISDINWAASRDIMAGLSPQQVKSITDKPNFEDSEQQSAKDSKRSKPPYRHVITLYGNVKPLTSYRNALNEVQGFIDQVAKDKDALWVYPLKMPIDLAPDTRLSEDLGVKNPNQADFILHIIYQWKQHVTES